VSIAVELTGLRSRYSNQIAEALTSKGYSLDYMYIVEPYAASISVSSSIISAVNKGVPNRNVMVGSSRSVGKGVVSGTTSTPNWNPRHCSALTYVGSVISK